MNADDRWLIEECRRGRLAAFGELVRRHQARLYNAVCRMVGNPEDAADVVQDTFLNAYQSLNGFKGDSEFSTWLYRIAFNASISHKRKRRDVLYRDDGSDLPPDPPDESADTAPGAALERDEDRQRLLAALDRLTPEHRAVLVLKEIEGQKYEEIAEILDVPIGTVRSRLHRARLELRERLEETEP